MMHTLKARVRRGRLLLDEPTRLPEGSEVSLILIEPKVQSEGERLKRKLRATDSPERRARYRRIVEALERLHG
jgi:hypothetical protein